MFKILVLAMILHGPQHKPMPGAFVFGEFESMAACEGELLAHGAGMVRAYFKALDGGSDLLFFKTVKAVCVPPPERRA